VCKRDFESLGKAEEDRWALDALTASIDSYHLRRRIIKVVWQHESRRNTIIQKSVMIEIY
jgi:hypothetical protein